MTTDNARFADLYDKYHGHVFAYCRRRVHVSEVEDVVAETFLTVWRRVEDVPDGEDALLWIYRIAYRVVGHAWRGVARASRLNAKLSSIGIDPHPAADEPVIRSHEELQAVTAASRLSAKNEEVLRLTVWEGLTNRQASEVLGISENAVRQRLHRAKHDLTREYNRLEKRNKLTRAAQEGGVW